MNYKKFTQSKGTEKSEEITGQIETVREIEETIKEHLCQHRSYKFLEYTENQDLAEILKKIVIKKK